jgi:hypothetical protein
MKWVAIVGARRPGATRLSWPPSDKSEPDFANYVLCRSTSLGVVADPTNVPGVAPETSLLDQELPAARLASGTPGRDSNLSMCLPCAGTAGVEGHDSAKRERARSAGNLSGCVEVMGELSLPGICLAPLADEMMTSTAI